ncbi:MAG: LysM peptidoglycan-binding domain-containing protein [Parachlamydia sp.]|nr:LysM peptidoglycan-binding domain-containing protein [Parachlamydia sp.]
MTRRDLIIVAALANVGVLAILFMLAFRTEEDQGKDSTEIAYTLTEESKPAPIEIPVKPEPMDMVDTALDDESAQQAPTLITGDDDNFQLLEPEKPQEIAAEPPKEVIKDAADARYVDVTIKRGDALEKIARANGTTVEAIMKANNLKNDRLRIGQTLKIPVGTNKKTAPVVITPKDTPPKETVKQIAKADTDNKAQYYTVKSGDNPWKIAKQFNLKLDELLKLNNLDQDKARNLKVGDTIRVK